MSNFSLEMRAGQIQRQVQKQQNLRRLDGVEVVRNTPGLFDFYEKCMQPHIMENTHTFVVMIALSGRKKSTILGQLASIVSRDKKIGDVEEVLLNWASTNNTAVHPIYGWLPKGTQIGKFSTENYLAVSAKMREFSRQLIDETIRSPKKRVNFYEVSAPTGILDPSKGPDDPELFLYGQDRGLSVVYDLSRNPRVKDNLFYIVLADEDEESIKETLIFREKLQQATPESIHDILKEKNHIIKGRIGSRVRMNFNRFDDEYNEKLAGSLRTTSAPPPAMLASTEMQIRIREILFKQGSIPDKSESAYYMHHLLPAFGVLPDHPERVYIGAPKSLGKITAYDLDRIDWVIQKYPALLDWYRQRGKESRIKNKDKAA